METLALVLGNNGYIGNNKLKNAVNDANAISEIFKKLRFEVITHIDFTINDIPNILTEFDGQIQNFDSTIVYFAGHGFEQGGENLLAATDCQILPSNDIHYYRRSCLRLNEILEILEKHPKKVNIVIIDACRKSFDRSGSIGLKPMIAPRGTLVAFSTSPGDGASDAGYGKNSLYTGSLLKYLGQEGLFAEELFKKVRRTVHNLSSGNQTTWEHTSLIGEFYFNKGQEIHSIDIPYTEKVVKDSEYEPVGNFGQLIEKVKIQNWHIQNPAIEKLLHIPSNDLNANEKFLLGRNLLQSSSAAFASISFMEDLINNLEKYFDDDENHLLNGILFEIYFDSKGSFRYDRTKNYHLEEILQLRKNPKFKKSFNFIVTLLKNTEYDLIYIPSEEDNFIDIDIIAESKTMKHSNGSEKEYQLINKIIYNSRDIKEKISNYGRYRMDQEELTQVIALFFAAPKKLIQISSNIDLTDFDISDETTDELF